MTWITYRGFSGSLGFRREVWKDANASVEMRGTFQRQSLDLPQGGGTHQRDGL